MHRQVPRLGLLLAALALAACGPAGDSERALTVSAAASLSEAFPAYGESLPGEERFSFGGSDQLAAQIRQGARPDVYASASPIYPRTLAEQGLAARSVPFARNHLVLVAGPDSPVRSLDDLAEPGADLVVGADGVPIGEYARRFLLRLPGELGAEILGRVRSEEPDVKAIVGKVAQGAADAGFVYLSDAAAVPELTVIDLPPTLAPKIIYAATVVADAAEPTRAREFIAGLRQRAGRRALRAAGLVPLERGPIAERAR